MGHLTVSDRRCRGRRPQVTSELWILLEVRDERAGEHMGDIAPECVVRARLRLRRPWLEQSSAHA
jgi:hypothetical protein